MATQVGFHLNPDIFKSFTRTFVRTVCISNHRLSSSIEATLTVNLELSCHNREHFPKEIHQFLSLQNPQEIPKGSTCPHLGEGPTRHLSMGDLKEEGRPGVDRKWRGKRSIRHTHTWNMYRKMHRILSKVVSKQMS